VTDRRCVAFVVATCLFGAAAAEAAAPDAARDALRVARRFAAEKAAGADDAFAKVVSIDPAGPLADDALVERALLRGLALWPDDLGRVGAPAWREAQGWLDGAASIPRADRAVEARYLLALGRLEPLPEREPDAARRALLAIASDDAGGAWASRARYAIGWLDREEGSDERARRAWMRVVVDDPRSDAAVRARLGLGVLDLAAGRPGRAALRAQEVVDEGGNRAAAAAALRAAALLDLGRQESPPRGFSRAAAKGSVGRSVPALAIDARGGWLAADRREGVVLRFDREGRPSGRWTVEDPTALAVDPFGRVLLASGQRLFFLDDGGVRPIADLGRFASASGIAADASGRVFVLDKRGDRIGVLEPGATAVVPLREERGTRVAGIAAIGGRLFGVGSRGEGWIGYSGTGIESPVAAVPAASVASFCIDPAGRIVVLDEKTGGVAVVSRAGAIVDRFDPRGSGVEEPARVACDADGSLVVLDGKSGALWRIER
jgi:hypothetical protein